MVERSRTLPMTAMSNDDHNQPVRLIHDESTGDRFLIYATEKGLRLDIRFEGATLWMTQSQIGELFGRDTSTISRHITNVIEEGELDEATSLQKVQTTTGRPATLYNLDMVISVGYRVSSAQATLFRRWATEKLVQFATKGFVIDAPRLKEPGVDRIAELREIIRDIRANEANVYAELRRICAMCRDYDPSSDDAREFYQRMQAKLFWAVVSQTPSMILANRADAAGPNMGLQTWPKSEIRQQDALTAKNYLVEREIRELNRLTTILLDIVEDQLDIGRLTLMSEAGALLDQQLKNLNRAVLTHGGSVSHATAEAKVRSEYKKFDAYRREQRRIDTEGQLAELKRQEKLLPKQRGKRRPDNEGA